MLLYFKVLSASKSCIDSTPQQSNFLTKSGKPHWSTEAKVYIAKSGGSELLQSAESFCVLHRLTEGGKLGNAPIGHVLVNIVQQGPSRVPVSIGAQNCVSFRWRALTSRRANRQAQERDYRNRSLCPADNGRCVRRGGLIRAGLWLEDPFPSDCH